MLAAQFHVASHKMVRAAREGAGKRARFLDETQLFFPGVIHHQAAHVAARGGSQVNRSPLHTTNSLAAHSRAATTVSAAAGLAERSKLCYLTLTERFGA